MTSRRLEKRTLQKCELSGESLNARIAPAGFHAGSLFVAGMGAHFQNGGGPIGIYNGPHDSNGIPFLLRTLDNKGITNFRIKGEVGNNGHHGSNHHGQPFLNLAVSKINTGFTTTNAVVTSSSFILRTGSTGGDMTSYSSGSNVATTPQFIVVPRPLINPPAPTGFPANPAPSSGTPQVTYILR